MYKVSTKIGTDSQTGGGEWKGHVFSGGDKKTTTTIQTLQVSWHSAIDYSYS